MDSKPLYRHTGVALLRAAAEPLADVTAHWPDLADLDGCRAWLRSIWSDARLGDAIRLASPSLGTAVDAIRSGRPVPDRRVRSATVSTMRYLLRRTGRPTPFGVFAGVAPAELGSGARVRWGQGHRVAARASSEWLADMIDRVEHCPEALERLDVVVTDLAVCRGDRVEVPDGPNRVTIRRTSVVEAVAALAAAPIRFETLAGALAARFDAAQEKVRSVLTELVRRRYLLTKLRAPFTVVDPLAHVVNVLRGVGVGSIPELAPLLGELESIQADLHRHNTATAAPSGHSDASTALAQRMRRLFTAGRSPLAVDLLLDCDIRLPCGIAHEIERAASALLRLTRQPRGEAAWRQYHAAFVDRYGTGTLVPLADVLDPDAGLGYPATYRGSVLTEPPDTISARDNRLLAMAWQALATGTREISLTDSDIAGLTDESFDCRYIPPHIELAARIHARSAEPLDAGDFRITVAPARSAGTLTSRFTPLATGCGLEQVYRDVPAATEGALRAQMSFGPVYPHAENVCRVPAYLDHVLPLGEHRAPTGDTVIPISDLALMATRECLHLISLSRRRVIEPQVFHALALDKQPPPLARFLAQLPRAFSAAWCQFDWGPHAELPFLPQVRYRRAILFPAQWRLTPDDLPRDPGRWPDALAEWRQKWDCPDVVELRDADRTLRLTLSEPSHASLLLEHLNRHEQAILTAAAIATEYGWIDGHVHEVAFPLITTRAAAPGPLRAHPPTLTNTHGQHPAAPDVRWLSAKIFTHPERITEIITEHLPLLMASLDQPPCWWLRYHSPHEPDHLRLRVRTDHYGPQTDALGRWMHSLRQEGKAGRLVLDTYWPEVGRYGDGPALDAAEDVFVADSATIAATLRHQPTPGPGLVPLVVANMVGIVSGFFGSPDDGMEWLARHEAVASVPAVERDIADRAVRLAIHADALHQIPGWDTEVGPAWLARSDALATYRKVLPPDANVDAILESLLHMHHNRTIGIDPDNERACRRLARQAALAWKARQAGDRR